MTMLRCVSDHTKKIMIGNDFRGRSTSVTLIRDRLNDFQCCEKGKKVGRSC